MAHQPPPPPLPSTSSMPRNQPIAPRPVPTPVGASHNTVHHSSSHPRPLAPAPPASLTSAIASADPSSMRASAAGTTTSAITPTPHLPYGQQPTPSMPSSAAAAAANGAGASRSANPSVFTTANSFQNGRDIDGRKRKRDDEESASPPTKPKRKPAAEGSAAGSPPITKELPRRARPSAGGAQSSGGSDSEPGKGGAPKGSTNHHHSLAAVAAAGSAASVSPGSSRATPSSVGGGAPPAKTPAAQLLGKISGAGLPGIAGGAAAQGQMLPPAHMPPASSSSSGRMGQQQPRSAMPPSSSRSHPSSSSNSNPAMGMYSASSPYGHPNPHAYPYGAPQPPGARNHMGPPVGAPNLPLTSHMRPPMPGLPPHLPPIGPPSSSSSSHHRSNHPGSSSVGSYAPPPPPSSHRQPSAKELARQREREREKEKDKEPKAHPMRPKDKAYEERIQTNKQRPPLGNVSGPAPVWASKRKGLTSALEYFQDPISTLGGSVEVGNMGLARMLLLEGDAGDGYVFWGTGRSLGTVVLPLGHPRPRREKTSADEPNPLEWSGFQDDDPIQHGSPKPGLDKKLEAAAITAGLQLSEPRDEHGSLKKDKDNKPHPKKISKRHLSHEAPEIAAMLLAHRARTPIVLAVSEDYGILPWKLPRAFIVLGWFWISDAWLEKVAQRNLKTDPPGTPPRTIVRWRFRFDWCKSGQLAKPWWGAASDVPCLFEGLHPDPDSGNKKWEIAAKDLSPCESVKMLRPGEKAHPDDLDRDMWNVCRICQAASLDVYSRKGYCLNETCPRFFKEPEDLEEAMQSRKIVLRALRDVKRVTPTDLQLVIRPGPLQGKTNSWGLEGPNTGNTSIARSSAGRDFWKGWCCNRCGMAGERRNWKGWDCEGCGNVCEPTRRIWTADMLADPARPIFTGPRIDDGFRSFPPGTVESAAIWDDGLRITLHGMEDQTEIHHSLSHSGGGFLEPFDHALEALQAQGDQEILFRRVQEVSNVLRPSDISFSPFYTYLVGSDATPLMEAIPSYKPKSWSDAPNICAAVIGQVNKLAGRMIEGERAFNTLLLVTMPAMLNNVYVPKIKIAPHTSMAFLVLGSDVFMTFRREGVKSKKDKGDITAFHGDLVLVRTMDREMEVGLKFMGFGFVAIARQIYPHDQVRSKDALQSYVSEQEYPPLIPTINYPAIKLEPPRPDPDTMAPEPSVKEEGWMLGGIDIFAKGQMHTNGNGHSSNGTADKGEGKEKEPVMDMKAEVIETSGPNQGDGMNGGGEAVTNGKGKGKETAAAEDADVVMVG